MRMAVEAVIGEPVSATQFPCYAGKSREILAYRVPRAMRRPISKQTQSLEYEFPKHWNREFRRLSREFYLA